MSNQETNLRRAGLKATVPRMQILEIIRSSPHRHLSAEDVYRQLLDQGVDAALATVYRALSQLEVAGLLSRHSFEGTKSVYEFNEGTHHDHLICVVCGHVDEFNSDAIESLQRQVAATQGYQLTDHRLILYGYCPDCIKTRQAVE